MTRRVFAALPAIVLIAGGLAGVWSGIRYGVWQALSPGAGFLPALSGGALCLLGVAIFATDVRSSQASAEDGEHGSGWRLLGYMVGLLGFALLMEPLGAIAAIVLLFLWILAGVEQLPWRLVLTVTAGATVGAWLLFDRLLQVPLPRGLVT